MFMIMGLGPAIGFFLSSQATSLYIDFDRVAAENIPDIPPYDPRWVGAWWLGFIVLGILLLILAFPFFLYPKRLPRPKDADDEKHDSIKEDAVRKEGNGVILKRLRREAVGVYKGR